MPPLDSIIAVILAGLALSITPGPSMLYVLSRSVGQSRAAGLASVFGLALGGMLLAVAAALGLAVIFAKFDWLVLALRYAGSIYLLWLGIGMIRDAYGDTQVSFEAHHVNKKPIFRIIWQGVLVELLNPKTVLFFALFLPPFVNLDGQNLDESSVQLQLLFLGILVPVTAIPSDLLIASMGGAISKALRKGQLIHKSLAWTGGLVLIGIAVNLHL